MTNSLQELANQVQQATIDLGLGDGIYDLIRCGTNDVFANKESGVVARVAPEYIRRSEIDPGLLNCQKLAAAGAPILSPLVSEAQALPGGRLVSFWPLAEVVEPDGREMAKAVLACHQLPPISGLTDWTPDLFVDRRWETLKVGIESGLPADTADLLAGLFTESLDRLKEICRQYYGSANGTFIHGDTNHSNFVRYQGRLVLCDPDNICRGPREKDLANIWESCRRHYINPSYWKQFLDNYHLDYDQEMLDILTRVQEVGGCMFVSQFWGERPEAQSALVHSLKTIDQPTARWVDF